MAYSILGIVNLAFRRAGIARISASDWATPASETAAEDAKEAWQYILDEVLEAKDWRFAKTRLPLEQRYEIPSFGYDYAYAMPSDFLRFPKGAVPQFDLTNNSDVIYTVLYGLTDDKIKKFAYPYVIETVPLPSGLEKITNGSFTGAATSWTLGAQWSYGTNNVAKVAGGVSTLSQAAGSMVSVPVATELYLVQFELTAIAGGSITPTIGAASGSPVSTTGVKQQYIEAIDATGLTFTPNASGVTCTMDNVSVLKVTDRLALLTDYDNSEDDIYINYIKRITDPTKYTAAFVDALANRLAAEVCIGRTEDKNKRQQLMQDYYISLQKADALNSSLDYLEGETGNNSWRDAGR